MYSVLSVLLLEFDAPLDHMIAARTLYGTYIRAGSKRELNCAASVKSRIKKLLDAGKVTVTLFDEAQKQAAVVLHDDVLPRFMGMICFSTFNLPLVCFSFLLLFLLIHLFVCLLGPWSDVCPFLHVLYWVLLGFTHPTFFFLCLVPRFLSNSYSRHGPQRQSHSNLDDRNGIPR